MDTTWGGGFGSDRVYSWTWERRQQSPPPTRQGRAARGDGEGHASHPDAPARRPPPRVSPAPSSKSTAREQRLIYIIDCVLSPRKSIDRTARCSQQAPRHGEFILLTDGVLARGPGHHGGGFVGQPPPLPSSGENRSLSSGSRQRREREGRAEAKASTSVTLAPRVSSGEWGEEPRTEQATGLPRPVSATVPRAFAGLGLRPGLPQPEGGGEVQVASAWSWPPRWTVRCVWPCTCRPEPRVRQQGRVVFPG